MSERTWQALSRSVAFWLGVYCTTYMAALSQGLIDLHATWGKLLTLASTVLQAYGIVGAFAFKLPREPWTPEQKEAESRRRIMRGEPPLAGFEYLIPSRGPDLPVLPSTKGADS